MDDSTDARVVMLNQLAEEFAARQRKGESPRLEEYCDRHPELAEDIRSLFPAMVELEQAKADAGPDLAEKTAATLPITHLGDFHLLREVGRGGMGVVYEAEQVSLGRRVALKLLPATVFSDPARRRRFEREAKAAAKLHHTNIVPVHGYGEHNGTSYYVMQFIPGLGLDVVIAELACSPSPTNMRLPTGALASKPTVEQTLSFVLARFLEDGAPIAVTTTTADEAEPGPVSHPGPAPVSSAARNTSSATCPAYPDPAIPAPSEGRTRTGRASHGSECKWPARWRTPINWGSCTGTSSHPTCCWTWMGSSGSPISVWPRRTTRTI